MKSQNIKSCLKQPNAPKTNKNVRFEENQYITNTLSAEKPEEQKVASLLQAELSNNDKPNPYSEEDLLELQKLRYIGIRTPNGVFSESHHPTTVPTTPLPTVISPSIAKAGQKGLIIAP